ncbi:uncharacterized protein LOC108104020 [Drosophila eugracilis]|uniref:uncharacterized protein LOC108104020 n=1 Tax=Drosophila eugracilis TaxID=29029 RepID=UPI001BD984F4|nr:uncharacterized protein LOC108104020 [Drosophila eugracilis]
MHIKIRNSEQDEDEISNEDETDLDGADWSMNVSYETGTPKRANSPSKTAEVTVTSALAVDNSHCPDPVIKSPEPSPSKPSGIAQLLAISRADFGPPDSIGRRVSRRSRSNMGLINKTNTTSQTLGEDTASAPPAQLAKPLDVTGFFHRVSVHLVQERICEKPFLVLRKRISRMVVQSLKDSKRICNNAAANDIANII